MTLLGPTEREAALLVLDEAGIDPRTVGAFGVTAQGYWEIQYDAEGRKLLTPHGTAKTWREWPSQQVGSAIYQALNPQ